MFKTFLILMSGWFVADASAADISCHGVLIGRGHTGAVVYPLTPMAKDPLLLSAKKDRYSFVVDTVDYDTTRSLRLFIHDVQGDFTALADGKMKVIGTSEEIRIQQIVGYETNDPLTISLSCFR